MDMSVAELPRTTTMSEAAFIRQAKQICQDLMPHNPAIYWADFFVSGTLAWVCLFITLNAELFSATQVIAFVVGSLMMYRASVFTHELAHLPPSRFRVFRFVWNVFFGCPFMMPSFLYTDHRVHHTNQTYGTDNDAEYYRYPQHHVTFLPLSMVVMFLLPFLPVIRFGILGPVSLLHPKIRKWVWEKASSLGTISENYTRAAPDTDERRSAWWQEAACFAVLATMVVLLSTGVMSWTSLALIYAMYVFAMMVNNVRVYAAHRYVGTGEPMTFLEQMLDSTTIPGGPWSALWAPLGMRYHALHHLFPAMPYHNMGAAHRRLMTQLPPNSPYHQTLIPNLWTGVMNLVREVRRAQAH
jgi:fatty acid desaturase